MPSRATACGEFQTLVVCLFASLPPATMGIRPSFLTVRTSCIPGSEAIRSRAWYIGDVRQHEQRPSKRLIDGAFVLSGYVPRDRAAGGYLLALREGVLTASVVRSDNRDGERRARRDGAGRAGVEIRLRHSRRR